MMRQTFFYIALILLPAMLLGGEPVDHSRADFDGPYVFHKKGKIISKSVEIRDSMALLSVKTYDKRSDVTLRCTIPATGDAFEFRLQDSLRIEPDHYIEPEKMLALSDIEGNFQAFKMILQGAKVIDNHFKWIFGKGHLVLVGDFFDRGLNVTECFWLIYKLESEAAAAGGKVHFILGNHEVINLKGETTYVRRKYIENLRILDEPYHKLYGSQTELGRWLRTKNAIEKIGRSVFCHGGISPELAVTGLSINEVNKLSRENLGREDTYITSEWAKSVFDQRTGVFWYRKAAKNMLSMEEMNKVLEYADADRMIVGHTLQPDISSYYKGKLICVDLYHEENVRLGLMKALWLENGMCYSIDSQNNKTGLFYVEVSTSKQ